jgi:hypothetical protein
MHVLFFVAILLLLHMAYGLGNPICAVGLFSRQFCFRKLVAKNHRFLLVHERQHRMFKKAESASN